MAMQCPTKAAAALEAIRLTKTTNKPMGEDFTSNGSLRAQVYHWLSRHEPSSRGSTVVHCLLNIAIAAAVAAVVFGTLPDLSDFQRRLLGYVIALASTFFTFEYVSRIWTAPEQDPITLAQPLRARWNYLCSVMGVIDLLVIVPLFLGQVFPSADNFSDLALLLSLFKLARYASSLSLFAAVFRNEAKALLSGLTTMMLLMVLVSGVMFALEHNAQPDTFRSIPDTMWWTIVTMATVGYGDITPITPLGKMFGGVTMLLGVAMFAVPAGILANGFAAEVRKRDFVVTWHTVASLPLFAKLDASRIANIAHLLKTQILPARQVVVRRDEPADAMFFIMSGEVEVDVSPEPVRLGKGQYFGEIALIKDTLRTATVTTLSECQMLSLEVHDFRKLIDQYPDLKAAIEHVADERLHHQNSGMNKPEGSS
jgi:voltage-gated potassium channel